MTGDAPRTWSRRSVLIGIVGFLLIVAAIAGLATLGLLYTHRNDRVGALNRTVTGLRNRVAQEGKQANDAYSNGYTAGGKAEDAFNKKYGLTYEKGLDAGWRDVFAGFQDPWIDNTWYLIKIKHGTHGHEIDTRYVAQVCRSIYADANDNVFLGPYYC